MPSLQSKNLTIEIATETVEKLKAENEKLREALEQAKQEAVKRHNAGEAGGVLISAAIEQLKSEPKRDYQTFYYTKEQP